ncbi:MAG: hypothetical protein CVU96_04945 [Firmicutes bacterium HGW-Firmicutes-20]|jgi:hypothetical protein|nr:MAG: hypothetical protein CVU96_04945 [Firmicutes bacterium HGW-Firmicutes-20]PKM70091.1 MAG: hypothetical protein CVU94_00925 [Firmicutes bacterium HGW-Firmicutes-19]
MKKLGAITLIALLTLTTLGCSKPEPKPSETVSKVLDLMKSDIRADFSPYFDGDVNNSDFLPENEIEENEFTKRLEARLIELYTDFDYVVVSETVSEDRKTAVVEVEFTTRDLGSFFVRFLTQYISKAFELAFSGKDEDEINEVGAELFETLSADLKKDKISRVQATLSNVDGQWLIDGTENANSPFFNGLTGGLIESIKEFSESFEETE